MKNPVANDIKEYAIKKLQEAYGYCGAAVGEENVMLNSDDHNGTEIIVTIKLRKD